MMRLAAAMSLVLLALAGCGEPADPVPPTETGTPMDPAPPTETGTPAATWAGLYSGRLMGYGFIGVDDQGYGPLLPAIAVDHEGRVLAFEVAYSLRSEDPPGLDLDAQSQPWRVTLAEVLAKGTIYPEDGPVRFRVRSAEVRSLASEDWRAARDVFENAKGHAREPTPNEGSYVADGASSYIGLDGDRVTLDDNHDQGGGWGDAEDQLQLLRAWMDGDG